MITAITNALQVVDANGEFSNVTLILQAIVVNNLPNLLPIQLQNMCNILNINTSGL